MEYGHEFLAILFITNQRYAGYDLGSGDIQAGFKKIIKFVFFLEKKIRI
jgi:hypothetical protein